MHRLALAVPLLLAAGLTAPHSRTLPPSYSGPADTSTQTITVTLLGTGKPIPAMDRFGAGTLVQAGPVTLLFDCGRGITQRLWQRHIPLSDVSVLFLTHLHSDHVVGIPDLWLTGWLAGPFGNRTAPFQVRGPAGTREMMTHLEKAYAADVRIRTAGENLRPAGAAIDAVDISEGVVYRDHGVTVTAFEVDHGPFIKPALGYRVDYGGRSVVISGDTRFNENLIRHAQGADVLVHEVAFAREELLGRSAAARGIIALHTTPEDAGRVFARVKPKLAAYTHVVLLALDSISPPPTVRELIERTRTTYAGPLVVGEDLMTIEVGDSVTVYRPGAGAARP
ncbi:MAG TPA: MBL fold metallo-hydrolase [Gemmatimonadaceae bacterium]|jgi:ribonuclease Z|nr:MBL fold metallo-hydrolase [Gemmatimonadaceae bacterium]